jgi:hypothetical protein
VNSNNGKTLCTMKLLVVLPLVLMCTNGYTEIREITVSNNQPFAISMPLRIPGGKGTSGAWNGQPAQSDGDNLVIVARANAGESLRKSFEPDSPPDLAEEVKAVPAEGGLGLSFKGQNLGVLQWSLIVVRSPKRKDTPLDGKWLAIRDTGEKRTETPVYQPDVSKHFQALPLQFERTASGPLFSRYEASATTGGLKLAIKADTFRTQFVTLSAVVTNESRSETKGVYCLLACRWDQTGTANRTLRYDKDVLPFSGKAITAYRAGDGHYRALMRGTDWIKTDFTGKSTALWLNDFTESYAVRVEASGKSEARWSIGNQPQIGQEAQSEGNKLFSISEVTRSTIPRFQDRFRSYTLFQPGEHVVLESQIQLSDTLIDESAAQDSFVGYACHKTVTRGETPRIEIGVPHVTFATSYFPFSTLGENFGRLKLGGQDREGFWPLSADTVTQWEKVKPDITRDLRIAKAMGFDVIRLHHLELIQPVEGGIRQKYLDFLFGELRELGLKALADIQLTPEETGDLVRRYRDVLSAVEVENEILIWGIKDGRLDYWNACYEASKKAAPEIPVHLTAHSNCGIFNKLFELGGHSDRIGFHSYTDGLSAIGSGLDMALAVGNYAAGVNRPAAITEWNWRFLTRIPFEERAKLYPQIVGDALKTRSISEFGQFQFIDSLAMNPASITAIRHYEPIFVSRRPKPEAFELMKLIRQYGDPHAASRRVSADHPVVTLNESGDGIVAFAVKNESSETLNLIVGLEIPSCVAINASLADDTKMGTNNSKDSRTFTLKPQSAQNIGVQIKADPKQPGFYHVFLKLSESRGGKDELLTYAWGEARMPGLPVLDDSITTAVTYDGGFAILAKILEPRKSIAIVYGAEAGSLELESAILVHNTLESAMGEEIFLYNNKTLPESLRKSNMILIGSAASNPMISAAGTSKPLPARQGYIYEVSGAKDMKQIVITGESPEIIAEAAADFVLRYWRNSKDSMVRRLGTLTEKSLPKGADAARLP